jgi:hypothetical protein
MKKLVFATQVFGIIALVPIVVILEMNHTKAGAFDSESTSGFKQETEMTRFSLPEKKNLTTEKDVLPVTPETFLLFKSF